MSTIQRFFMKVFPKQWAKDMESDSRSWMVRCPECEFEQSIWDMGGIRWKASGKPSTYFRCTSCGQRGWHKVYKKQ